MGKNVGGRCPEYELGELKRFFRSGWYETLTNINGEWLMCQVKIRELDKVIEAYKAALSGDREVKIKISLPKTKTKEKVDFNIPPVLMGDFLKMIGMQKEILEQKKRDLQGE